MATDQEWSVLSVIFFVIDLGVFVHLTVLFVIWEGVRIIACRKRGRDVNGRSMMTVVGSDRYPVLSVFLLVIFRCICLYFGIVTHALDLISHISDGDGILHAYQFFTVCSFAWFCLYYLYATPVSILYLGHVLACKWMGKPCSSKVERSFLQFLAYVQRLVFSVACTRAVTVVLLYWLLLTPMTLLGMLDSSWNPDYFTAAMHVLNGVFLLLEFCILRELRWTLSCSALNAGSMFGYAIWVTLLVKTRYLDEFPYGGLISYDRHFWAIFVRYGSCVALVIIFLVIYVLNNVRRLIFVKLNKGIVGGSGSPSIVEDQEADRVPTEQTSLGYGVASERSIGSPALSLSESEQGTDDTMSSLSSSRSDDEVPHLFS